MISRYSSRRQPLDGAFLQHRLKDAQAYDRIAGYFRSSLFSIAGEAIESISGPIRIVCNSDLDIRDVQTARAAQQAMRWEWCESRPERFAHDHRERFRRLYDLLMQERLRVRVLPREKFGLAHGKAGVITLADGSKTTFLGSTNSTRSAWSSNYELLWEDDSQAAIDWVQEEFEALWEHTYAQDLADFVIKDIGRLAERTVIQTVDKWKENPEPASASIELPVFREGFGLWEHQKYFVDRAFKAHRRYGGARFVLADMVGLGKTLQLTLSAMLMALEGDGPILVLAPKPLLWQWQEEMTELLDMPSAVWDSQKRSWIDEHGIEHPSRGHEGIKNCPRRVGIVSQGLVVHQSEAMDYLQDLEYECVIVDEAHKARRRNRNPFTPTERPDPNNLMAFLLSVSPQTKSMLLATATPVQLHPLEGWDLLYILAQGDASVLGNQWSKWQRAGEALKIVKGEEALPKDDYDLWEWVRNPLPPSDEERTFELLRRSLGLDDTQAVAPGDAWRKLNRPDQQRVRRLRSAFAEHHNPFIRHVVRRTREYLENTINPETEEPYMDPINVELHGEGSDESIPLPAYLEDAYSEAEDFCELLGERMNASGFMETLLLRRVGSTIAAGQSTAEKILQTWRHVPMSTQQLADGFHPSGADEESDEDDTNRILTTEEADCLRRFIDALKTNRERDPKYHQVVRYLLDRGWIDRGCIVFSQYFDSVWWLANQLSQDDLPNEKIGIYAAREKSGIVHGGEFVKRPREDLKRMVREGDLRLLIGTESASEGLNLQRLSTLINLDLPWNPTRLEQRKGRIQRIGQQSDTIYVYNMRYRDSVEDRVHELLSERLKEIHNLFGQVPDVLEDVWIDVMFDQEEEARRKIGEVPDQHPFEMRYEQIERVEWESCTDILEDSARRERLSLGW